MRRLLALFVLVVLVVAAGCVAPADPGHLGSENGYHYDDSISVTVANGLNASEREVVVGRAMARIERIRHLEFRDTVQVTVISRAEYRNRTTGGSTNLTTRQRWNEQVWEALHLVGENATVPGSRSTNQGSTVVGYYSPSKGKIVIVSDSSTPTVDRRTLVHELVHALQDQQLKLYTDANRQDRQLAVDSVVEGDANYVSALYQRHCRTDWSCIDRPTSIPRSPPAGFNQGLFMVSYFPYAEGPRFVDAIRSRGGWAAVDDLYEHFPASTEQVIHPDRYPTDKPETVTVPDRARGGWERFTNLSTPRSDTVGEGSIYAMFVATGVIDRSGASQYDYDHHLSDGWAGDRLVPYRNGDGEYGYVWRINWESTADARAFTIGYRKILDTEGAKKVRPDRYVVPSGAYADAFRVTRDGRTVTIVNAPTAAGLDRIHAPS